MAHVEGETKQSITSNETTKFHPNLFELYNHVKFIFAMRSILINQLRGNKASIIDIFILNPLQTQAIPDQILTLIKISSSDNHLNSLGIYYKLTGTFGV